MPSTRTRKKALQQAENYRHPESESLMRPEVGTQAQFRKTLPPKKYRYDDSLAPVLEWDGQNPARERGEAHLAVAEASLAKAREAFGPSDPIKLAPEALIEIKEAVTSAQESVQRLKAMSKPFLNWAGKAERLSFDVPTLPLFIHERLSTKAILETLKGHKRDKQTDMLDLFGDPRHSITDQVLRAYEHKDKWVNRMILGDSLLVMNSLLHYEGLGGQVQMIYIDPPYGVSFGSNFQPFVRTRDVGHNDDEEMTREPEMVQAYRDTWELGLHSYLTYLRDRLLLARELLGSTGSIFVQINDENLHHVRELMDEVFGSENLMSIITFEKTSSATTKTLPTTCDYLLWYAKQRDLIKFRKLYVPKVLGSAGATEYKRVELADGTIRPISEFFDEGRVVLPSGARLFTTFDISSKGGDDPNIPLEWDGKKFLLSCKPNRHWKQGVEGTKKLWEAGRLLRQAGLRIYKRYFDDFPYSELTHVWVDTRGESDAIYVVQTSNTVVQRCMLMTTEPGDLVLDPTCGSGTTAYVAEQWGRRWITCDTSRVPLALARQRLLTATFGWYALNDGARGPSGGFTYERRQNNKGKEVGGIVPHIMAESIAKNEPPPEEVLVDKPKTQSGITRVTGPFTLEGTIPGAQDFEEIGRNASQGSEGEIHGSFVDRMLEILRKSPVLRLEGNRTVTLKNVRPPAKTLSLSAEAMVDATAPGQRSSLSDAVQEAKEKNGMALPLSGKPVALVFGPENSAVSERLVSEAAKEANLKSYTHLYVIGFSIQPNARLLIENCEQVVGIPATYVQATPDLMMGDLLKNMRSSQIFSVCGLPDAKIRKAAKQNGSQLYEAELLGVDVFDPISMEVTNKNANDVPAWFLDTDYNGLCFHVSQAFFPRTSAWESLKKALKVEYEESVWDHLAGTVSAPFEAGEQGQVAIKVIDDRGNELLIVKSLKEEK